MNKLQRGLITGVAILGLGTGAISGFAQTSVNAPAAAQSAHAERAPQRMAKRQAALHDALKLTAAQEPAWHAFAQGMQSTRDAHRDGHRVANLTGPERADRMVDRATAREQQATKRAALIKQLYATLSPEQQKTFDAATQRHHEHRGEHRERAEG